MGPGERAVAAEVATTLPIGRIDPEVREVIETCLAAARERLGMEIAWMAEFHVDRNVFRVVEGGAGWALRDDDILPAAESYCHKMLAGEMGNAVRDTALEPAVANLEVTQRLSIRAYVGVPLVLADGRLFGSFCCARTAPCEQIDERDVRFVQVLSRIVAEQLAFRATERELRAAEARTAAGQALGAALDLRDAYTGEHSREVVELAVGVARRLGLSDAEVADVELVALLHDVGKVGVPDALLRKPAALSEDEWQIMRRHPAMGAEIVERIAALEHLAAAVRAEHERWDGRGYPQGLARDAIPVASRITLVCDGYHAMVSDRPYRAAMAPEAAVAELRRCSGTMFWPQAVEALLAELAAREPGV